MMQIDANMHAARMLQMLYTRCYDLPHHESQMLHVCGTFEDTKIAQNEGAASMLYIL